MSVRPRKTEVKKFLPILEQDYESPEQAAEAILQAAYDLYEEQAKWYIVGQVRPGTGWKSPEEGRDAKVLLGPFGTEKQARAAGQSLAYSSQTGEEAMWWPVQAWYGTPAAWYDERKQRWQREGFMDKSPREHRLELARRWFDEHPGEPLPEHLHGLGWEGLDAFMQHLIESS